MDNDYSFSLYSKGQTPLLPAFLKPKSDELFSSWVVRLAHAHYMKAHTFTSLLFPRQQFWNRDIDKSVKDNIIEKLSILTNSTYKEINDTTLKFYEGKLIENLSDKSHSKWIIPLGVYHRTWRNKSLMFCPKCLGNDGNEPYYRKHWRISLFYACTKCSIYLQNCCPKCEAPITFFRAGLGRKSLNPIESIALCSKCKFNLTLSPVEEVSTNSLKIQKKIDRIINRGWKSDVIYSLQFYQAFHLLVTLISSKRKRNMEVQKRLHSTLKYKYYPPAGGYENRFDVSEIKERERILIMAFYLLKNWPYNFIKFFKEMNLKSSDLISEIKAVPFWYYETVFSNFHFSNINRKYVRD